MVRLDMDRNCVRVYEDSTVIGSIELYDNLYHRQNQYLKMDDFTLKQYLPGSQKSADYPYQAFSYVFKLD